MKPLPQRKSPRLQGYDYSSEGMYFVTICTYQRALLFGDVVQGAMQLDDLGNLAEWHWRDLPNHFPHVVLDAFVVMPNHMYGIVITQDLQENIKKSDSIDALPTGERDDKVGTRSIASVKSQRPKLGTIIGTYKAAVTRQARIKLNFTDRIWQPRYYDHIVRKEESFNYILQYVLSNPAKWEEDEFHKESNS